MIQKWTATYVRDDNIEEQINIEIFGETIFQAWYNAMCVIQIIEKTQEFTIKGVKPKKSN
tara:strand:- start:51 stop:230 length:180 start_codon:yes stop_codon:yes gene_type:complete